MRSAAALGWLAVALVGAGCGGKSEVRVAPGAYWLGRSFDGLSLEKRAAGYLIYGTCEPVGTENPGCFPPVEVRTLSVCNEDPLKVSGVPHRRFLSRGALVQTYGEGALRVFTGTSTIEVFGDSDARAHRAIALLRRAGDPPGGSLAPPALPESTRRLLADIERTVRRDGLRSARLRFHRSITALRDRLALARLLRRAHTGTAHCG